jgi:hypothetical protein
MKRCAEYLMRDSSKNSANNGQANFFIIIRFLIMVLTIGRCFSSMTSLRLQERGHGICLIANE